VGRGAPGAPSPQRQGSGEGTVPPPDKISNILMLKWHTFIDSLVLNFVFLNDPKQ